MRIERNYLVDTVLRYTNPTEHDTAMLPFLTKPSGSHTRRCRMTIDSLDAGWMTPGAVGRSAGER